MYSHRLRLKLTPQQLLDGLLQGGTVRAWLGAQVDRVVRPRQAGAFHVRGIQGVDDVDARREATCVGAGGGPLEGVDPRLQPLHLLRKCNESNQEAQEEQQGEEQSQQPFPPGAAGPTSAETIQACVLLADLCMCCLVFCRHLLRCIEGVCTQGSINGAGHLLVLLQGI